VRNEIEGRPWWDHRNAAQGRPRSLTSPRTPQLPTRPREWRHIAPTKQTDLKESRDLREESTWTFFLISNMTYSSCFFFRWNISVILAEIVWSLKHFGLLSHSCIKTHHRSVFSLYFETLWLKWLNLFRSFQKRFGLWPKNNRKKQHSSNGRHAPRFAPCWCVASSDRERCCGCRQALRRAPCPASCRSRCSSQCGPTRRCSGQLSAPHLKTRALCV